MGSGLAGVWVTRQLQGMWAQGWQVSGPHGSSREHGHMAGWGLALQLGRRVSWWLLGWHLFFTHRASVAWGLLILEITWAERAQTLRLAGGRFCSISHQ